MKKVLAFCMVVLALVACMAPAGMDSNLNTKICSDLRPKTEPYDIAIM